MENLDSLMIIYKNWFKDGRVGCSFANVDINKFFAIKTYLLKFHEVELGEVGMFEED